MPRAVEKVRQVKINDPRLVADDRFSHPTYRLLGAKLFTHNILSSKSSPWQTRTCTGHGAR
jgi:hypothetical protein